MRDQVLNYLIQLILDNSQGVMTGIWLLCVWRVATLRGLTQQNFKERVSESVSETLKEKISNMLDSLLTSQNVPHNTSSYDLLSVLLDNNPNDVALLAEIYSSLENFGVMSSYYEQVLIILQSLL